MNLYELAHHPDAWSNESKCPNQTQGLWFGDSENSNQNQFDMLNETDSSNPSAQNHNDENEFRMHLLFVYFATTDSKEWPCNALLTE